MQMPEEWDEHTWSSPKSLPPFNLLQLRGFLVQTWILGTEHPSADFTYISSCHLHPNTCKPPAFTTSCGKEFLGSVTDCMKTTSFILNLSSVSSIWCLFVLLVKETVNNQSLATLSCHSLVYIPQASLFAVWRIPVYLILPSTGVTPITLTSLLPFSEPFQFSYILWNTGTRTACSIQRWEMVLCCVLCSFPHNFSYQINFLLTAVWHWPEIFITNSRSHFLVSLANAELV